MLWQNDRVGCEVISDYVDFGGLIKKSKICTNSSDIDLR